MHTDTQINVQIASSKSLGRRGMVEVVGHAEKGTLSVPLPDLEVGIQLFNN
jgi:hypothetical protein